MKLNIEIVSDAEIQKSKANKKIHEKRLGIERRRFSYTYQIPERRKKNRGDRRKNSAQKNPTEKT